MADPKVEKKKTDTDAGIAKLEQVLSTLRSEKPGATRQIERLELRLSRFKVLAKKLAKMLAVMLPLLIAGEAKGDYLYAVSSLDSTMAPPLDVGSGKGKIVAVVPQVRTAVWSLFEVWGEAPLAAPGVYYRATVLRQTFPNGRLLWTVKSDSNVWYRYLALWAEQDVSLVGPVRLYNVQNLTQTQCEATATRTLVGVTTDAGTLKPPPSLTVCTGTADAGVPIGCSQQAQSWPDASVLRCGTGGYYLRQWKWGGGLQEPDPDPGLMTDPLTGTSSALPPVGIAAGVWNVPPAPTTKTCTVPVGTACP